MPLRTEGHEAFFVFRLAVHEGIMLIFLWVLWKRLTAETSHHGNASKKRTHKTNLMSSSLIKKLFLALI